VRGLLAWPPSEPEGPDPHHATGFRILGPRRYLRCYRQIPVTLDVREDVNESPTIVRHPEASRTRRIRVHSAQLLEGLTVKAGAEVVPASCRIVAGTWKGDVADHWGRVRQRHNMSVRAVIPCASVRAPEPPRYALIATNFSG
jgi:hypothetical protein